VTADVTLCHSVRRWHCWVIWYPKSVIALQNPDN